MERRTWIPFFGATLAAIILAAILAVFEVSDTAALAVGAVAGSAIVAVSIPYVFGVRDRRLVFSQNGRNGRHVESNQAAAEVRLTHDLLELAGQQTRASGAGVDVTVATSAR